MNSTNKYIVIYIAGPYSGETGEEVCENIAIARKMAIDLIRFGYSVICPHTMTANMEYLYPDIPYEAWINMYKELLSRCDCVMLLPGWENSEGTQEEIQYAKELLIPVYNNIKDLNDDYQDNELETV